MLEVTTESGRKYHVDPENRFWMRIAKTGEHQGGWERIWTLQKGTHFAFPWDSPEGTWEDGLPEVGKFMFVSSKDQWWTSTEVVSIEEIPSEFED